MEAKYQGRTLPILYYRMPIAGKSQTLVVNGVECESKTTKWGEFRNTYWVYKNVSMYVREYIPDGSELTLENVPDNFGAAEKPLPRTNYYKRSKVVENV